MNPISCCMSNVGAACLKLTEHHNNGGETMGLYQHIRDIWKSPSGDIIEMHRKRLAEWRDQDATLRVQRPTRLDRARSLGYKAKEGFIVVRQRVDRGGHMRPWRTKGRRSKTQRRKLILAKSYKQIAEERASKAYTNFEVLNSYPVGKDGLHFWYEVILVQRDHPHILGNRSLKGVAQQTGRAHRGLTIAGRKSRGLLRKGRGVEKARPSHRARGRRQN